MAEYWFTIAEIRADLADEPEGAEVRRDYGPTGCVGIVLAAAAAVAVVWGSR